MNQQQYEYEVMREMELRDYFAGQAMQSLIQIFANTENTVDLHRIADISWQFSKVMMEYRKNG